MNPQNQSNPSQPEEEESIDLAAELRISFPEGFYMHSSGEIRRATLAGARVLWFESEFDTFVMVEPRSKANTRRLLEEVVHLPNYVRQGGEISKSAE